MSERSLGSVVVAVKAVDEASSVMDRIRASCGVLGGTLSELGGGFASVGSVVSGFAGAGVAGAATAALGEVIKGLQWSVGEASASEQAFKNLADAVDRSGTSWTSVEGKTRDYLSQLQRTTVYSDEALAGTVERLLTFGMTYDQAMSAAGTALDLAAAKHMDLQSAADVMGKAFMGNASILKRYGIEVEASKDSSVVFSEALAKVNEQFGGAAQEQAKTYVGIQERLKNATSEVGEKIGEILLPALASMTEAMIPVVDWLGNGVSAIQGWLTEVGKMPEVQGAMAVVNEAFQGLWKYLSDVWKFMQDTFGPAIKELMAAFKELWDALSPIGDALKELLSIFGDTGNLDLLKFAISLVVLQIRAVAAIIKEVAPYIKTFAQAFRDAADFVTPILTQIVGAVRAFTGDLRSVFQSFYNWLVGGSLWTDLWDRVLAIASQMVGQLISDLGSRLFSPMQTAFTNAMQQVQSSWNSGWQAVQTAFNTITSQVQTDLNRRLDTMIANLRESTNQYAPTAAFALQGMQSTMNAVMALIHGDWQGALTQMQNALGAYWGAIQSATGTAFAALQGAFSTGTGAIRGILDAAIAGMEAIWTAFIGFMSQGLSQLQGILGSASASVTATVNMMQSAAGNAVSQIQSTLSNAWTAITTGAQDLWNTLVGHSIWTDMLDEMQAQTASALGNIVGNFQNISFAVPATVPYSLAPTSSPAASTPTARTAPSLAASQSITIPITVTLDGQVVAKTVKKILIEERQYRDRSVGGY
jgi:phage-related protein